MCKEDVRIKRKTKFNARTISPVSPTPVLVFPPNPDRAALTAVAALTGFGNAATACYLYTVDGGQRVPIGSFGANQFLKVTIEEVGVILTGEIWVADFGSSPPDLCDVCEIVFMDSLENL